jgi:hypothetical protein
MPFLHEGNGNVTITPTQLDYRPKSSSVSAKSFNPNSVRLHRILQREAAASAPAGQIQRRAAQRKLQMAKMLSNGGITAAALNFQRNHHENSNQNDPLFVASRRARSNNFTLKETFDLLKIWASPEMQWQMKHNFRNFRVWEAISFAMHESGHDRTAIQCKNRIQNLTSIFYRIKKSKQDYRTFNFPYYKLIGDVLDGKKNGTSSMNPSTAMSLSNSAFLKNNNSAVTISPSQNSTAGFAAHMALVEEYQHLINGNPEVYITPTGGQNSSNNSNSGLNVLSPEVSLSEGDSPIRVENQASRSSVNPASQASSSKDTPKSSHNSAGMAANRNGSSTGSLLKVENEDSVTVTVTDDANNSENEMKYDNDNDMDNSDLDENMLGQLNDSISEGNEGFPASRTKRSFSANYAPYGKASFTSGLGNGNAAKRPRGASTATNASSNPDDQIGAYLAEMIDIERQWLDMERERAENERSMMMYMMQILQALVCPGQSQDDNDEESNGNENDGMDEESPENENEDDTEENEIHQMIEQEENNIDDGEDGEADADD